MPSLGPELPPHLSKRKRSSDEAEDPKSPPKKVLAATAPSSHMAGPTMPPSTNPEELNIEDSSGDDYGPSLGPSKPPTKTSSPPAKRVLEPALPSTTNPDKLDVDDSSDDGYGPSAPSATTKPAKRILGPAPPPAPLSELPSHPANDDSSSSDDDDYGPSRPPAPGSAAEIALLLERQQAQAASTNLSSTASTNKPQRDDWMLVPPSDSDWTTKVDPTKLKNRKFASGKGAKAPAEKTGVSAIWTETPEQKRQRLADQVLGREDTSQSSGTPNTNTTTKGGPSAREVEATERRIREYNEKNRGKSLLEARKEAQERGKMEKEEDDDPSKRGFDREKDMALGGSMGHGKKKEMLAKAADFGSRFQRGKYL